jgi:hypothetical protein
MNRMFCISLPGTPEKPALPRRVIHAAVHLQRQRAQQLRSELLGGSRGGDAVAATLVPDGDGTATPVSGPCKATPRNCLAPRQTAPISELP